MSQGRVYLVGAGPGDPGLITVRGRDLIARADVVVYDYLSSPRLLEGIRPDAERIYVGKQAGAHTLSQDEINKLLVAKAAEGATVVRLKGGDPFVFGRGGEEALALVQAGIGFEVVPGVTAGIAAAAYAGIPATHRGMAASLALITGHEAPGKSESDLDFETLAKWTGTLAFYMGVRNVGRICQALMDHGMDGATPAALIRWGTTPRQQVVTGTVGDIAERVRAAGLKPPALIVIGEVVGLREDLSWFERRPLFGRRIIVTRARRQASRLSDRLQELGAEVLELPTIRIESPQDPAPLEQAAQSASSFDWTVFTSVNAVDALFGALDRAGLDSRAIGGCKVCAIGPSTAQRLGRFGIRPDLQPPAFNSAAVCDALAGACDLRGARILYPRADIAPRDLPDALASRGADVTDVVAYRTVPEPVDPDTFDELFADGVAWITFTSSSTVRNFFDAVPPGRLDPAAVRAASIGPATSRTLGEFGVTPAVEADTHTIAGLVDAIIESENREPGTWNREHGTGRKTH